MLHVSANISSGCVTCVSLFNFRHPRDATSPTSRRGTLFYYSTYVHMYQCVFFHICTLFPASVGLFLRSRLRGTQGARLYKTVQVWAPAGLHDACSGRLKSLNLACNHGVPFRGARAKQDNGKHTNQNANFSFLRSAALLLHQLQVPHRPSKCVYFDVATVQQQPRFKLFPL